jgi:predicted permease
MNLWKKITTLFRKRKLDADMAEEMRAHVERRTQANLAAGMSPDEARYAARRQFGGVEQLKEVAREQRGWRWLEEFSRDFRQGLRSLAKSWSFSAVALLTLALGIGACTAIFSVVNSVLLRPLAYPESERLMVVHETKLPQVPEFSVAPANYIDWRTQATSFEQLAALNGTAFNLTGNGEPMRVPAERVTPNYLATFRARPLLGRDFTEEDTAPGNNVVLLTHGFWTRQFGARREIVGGTLPLNGQVYTVIGVLPENFRPGNRAELYVPRAYNADSQNRGGKNLRVVGRLKDGVTVEQARKELTLIAANLARQYPDLNTGWSVKITPLLESAVGSASRTLFTLLGAVGFLLLIACANVANLLLARATVRSREIAVRTAVGASRGRIVRQLLTESLVLAACGGALGVAVAYWGVDALLAFAPTDLPRIEEIALDGRALGFTCGLALLTGIAFGLVPAFQASRVDLNQAFKDGGRGGSDGTRRQRLRSALVVAEVATALILLVGAGLLFRSFGRLRNVDPGFSPGHAITAAISLPNSKYGGGPQQAAFVGQAIEQLAAIPGVEAAGAAHVLPFSDNDFNLAFRIDGRPEPPPDTIQGALYYAVTPDYFKAMGIPLRRGRLFTDADVAGRARALLINEALAKRYFPNEDPIGQRITITGASAEIVGIMADVQHYSLDRAPQPQVYEPFAQQPFNFITFVVRPAGPMPALPDALRAAVYAVDRDQPVASVRPLTALLSASIARQRFATILFTAFSGVALLLAAIGIYGVMAYTVTQRTNEIGIRMALGAQQADVLRLVFTQGGRLIALGLVCGLGGALLLTRYISSLLFGVSPTDPLTFAAIGALLAAVAAVACLIPARRATKVDPVVALRAE